jgi:hypothetical protein
VGDGDSPVDFLLGCIAVSTCESYLTALSAIPSLTTNSARQLAVDIGEHSVVRGLASGVEDPDPLGSTSF